MSDTNASTIFAMQTKDHELPTPEPLTREPPAETPFPLDALCDLQSAADAIHDITDAPIAIGAQSLLAAISLAAQSLINVRVPYGGRDNAKPASLFLATIAKSGERKNSADNEALKAVHDYEEDAQRKYNTEMLPSFKQDHAIWSLHHSTAVKKGDRTALAQLGPEPVKPPHPMLLTDDPTFESICKHFAGGGRRSLGLFATEGGKFLSGPAMFEDTKVKTAAGFSNLWDGEPVRRMRASEEAPLLLTGRRLSMHLMVQPDIGAALYSDKALSGQGLLSRLLVAWPKSAIGHRPDFHQPSEKSIRAMDRHYRWMRELLEEADDRYKTGKPLMPVKLSQKATQEWQIYYNSHEKRMRVELADVTDFVNKMPEQIIRLAALLWVAAGLQTQNVVRYEIEAAAELTDYYIAEMKRLHAAASIDQKIRLSIQVSEWLARRNTSTVSLTEVYQKGPRGVRTKASAVAVVQILEDHKHLIRADPGKDVWRVNRPF
jgi:hypothetical protein